MSTGPQPRYTVEIAPSALKQLGSLPRKIQERIGAVIDALRFEPRPRGVKTLSGADDIYRARVGSYRIVYTIRDDRLIVLVLRIGDRKDVYRGERCLPTASFGILSSEGLPALPHLASRAGGNGETFAERRGGSHVSPRLGRSLALPHTEDLRRHPSGQTGMSAPRLS